MTSGDEPPGRRRQNLCGLIPAGSGHNGEKIEIADEQRIWAERWWLAGLARRKSATEQQVILHQGLSAAAASVNVLAIAEFAVIHSHAYGRKTC
jgi:hypothetical protein